MCSCRAKKTAAAAPEPTSTPTPGTRSVRSAPPPPPVPTQTRTITEEVTYVPRDLMLRRRKPAKKTVVREVPVETVDTSIWGAHVWRILHTASFAATAAAWSGVLKALDGALPCPDCREHYHAWILARSVPSELADIRCWLLELHNQVNGRTEKAAWTESNVCATWGTVTDADIVTVRESLAFVGPMLGSEGLAALTRLVDSLTPVVTPMPLVESLVPESEPVVTESEVVEPVVPETDVNESEVVEPVVPDSVVPESEVVESAETNEVSVEGPTLIVTDVPLSAE